MRSSLYQFCKFSIESSSIDVEHSRWIHDWGHVVVSVAAASCRCSLLVFARLCCGKKREVAEFMLCCGQERAFCQKLRGDLGSRLHFQEGRHALDLAFSRKELASGRIRAVCNAYVLM